MGVYMSCSLPFCSSPLINIHLEFSYQLPLLGQPFLAFHKLYQLAEESVYLDIWLIDHNLKRRKGVLSQKDSLKSAFYPPQLSTPFYANDRKFLKVNLEQGEGCLDYWQYLKPMHDGDYQKSSLDFADRLRQRVYDFAFRDYGDCHRFSCYSGLLGWDDL